jgi:hypothetical protein
LIEEMRAVRDYRRPVVQETRKKLDWVPTDVELEVLRRLGLSTASLIFGARVEYSEAALPDSADAVDRAGVQLADSAATKDS